jgi:hypothetical protein
MDGEDPDGEILVFMGELRDAGVEEYSAFVKGGLLGLTSTWRPATGLSHALLG